MKRVITFDKGSLKFMCEALKVPYDESIIAFTKEGAVTNIIDLLPLMEKRMERDVILKFSFAAEPEFAYVVSTTFQEEEIKEVVEAIKEQQPEITTTDELMKDLEEKGYLKILADVPPEIIEIW